MILIFLVVIIILYERDKERKRLRYARYKEVSGIDLTNVSFDKGTYGEFLIFEELEKLDDRYRVMTNLYLPKEDGTTTEVDLIMITQVGIFVFESKNYGGWIFGNESHKNWTQIFRNQQRNRFFNPIWQNNGHIQGLKLALGVEDDRLYKSYIVFSERCELKDITVHSPRVKVLKRGELLRVIREDIQTSRCILEAEHIERIYLKLEQYTRVDRTIKEVHVENLQKYGVSGNNRFD